MEDYKYDLSKSKDDAEKREQEKPAIPAVDPRLMQYLGVKEVNINTKKITPEVAEKCQALIAGAVQLMYRRYTGQEEFRVSKRQYEKWLVDIKRLSVQVVTGEKSYEELELFVKITINMPEEKETPTSEEA